MRKTQKDLLRYLTINNEDEKWGIVCTTVGYQVVTPGSSYPVSRHPETYNFKKLQGRILNEYQLVYIIEGSGYFVSESCKKTRVTAGTMIQLFPGEWHLYHPDPETGWVEYWIGFRGANIDKRIEMGFFPINEPLHKIGVSETIIRLYDDVIKFVEKENTGYQQLISGIVLHILGAVYYKRTNRAYANNVIVDKINKARMIMRDNIENPVSPENIAKELGLGYSWFRRVFKQYTGTSPSQYQLQLKLIKAKELLSGSGLRISEVAYAVGFDSVSQFSSFFKNKEKITPSEFKDRTH